MDVFKTLYSVLNHYDNEVQISKTLSNELNLGVQLTEKEKVDLVTFLLTLSDKEFLFNPKFGYPIGKY